MTKSWTSKQSLHLGGVFTLMGAYMMVAWAQKKKSMLLKSIEGTNPKLESILKKKPLVIPGVL